MVLVVDKQILFRKSVAVAEMNDFEFHAVQANALVAILAVDQRLAVFELDDVSLRASFSVRSNHAPSLKMLQFCRISMKAEPMCAAAFLSVSFRCSWKTSTVRATNEVSAPIARPSGLNGRSAVPYGVDFVFLPNSEVGEY